MRLSPLTLCLRGEQGGSGRRDEPVHLRAAGLQDFRLDKRQLGAEGGADLGPITTAPSARNDRLEVTGISLEDPSFSRSCGVGPLPGATLRP